MAMAREVGEARREVRCRWRDRNVEFGARMRRRRLAIGLSRAEASARTGIPQSSWKGYECGWSAVPRHRLAEIARVLGRSVDWLVTGRGRRGGGA
jgi:transcriptional regulator with XRE-family HTH domain